MSCGTARSMDSVQESSNAPDPVAPVLVAPPTLDTIRSFDDRQSTGQLHAKRVETFLQDLEDACPWSDFLERSFTTNAMDDESDVFPLDMEGSMHNNVPLSSGERSMLSSFMSSLQPPSATMSDIVRNAGARFPSRRSSDRNNCYLRLN